MDPAQALTGADDAANTSEPGPAGQQRHDPSGTGQDAFCAGPGRTWPLSSIRGVTSVT
jgi:hypothetical protein